MGQPGEFPERDFRQRVAARFDSAAESYDAHSSAQRHAAARLASLIAAAGLPPRPGGLRVLEIGCGTGHLSELLARQLPDATLLVTDLAPAMVAACRQRLGSDARLGFAVMDGCHPAGTDHYDLICANLAAQWFPDLPAALGRWAARLAPGGMIALSLLGAASFREWRAAHARCGLPAGALPLPTPADCRAALPPGDNRVTVERWQDRPADGLAFLRALRAIGADTAAPGSTPLAPGALRRVLRALGPAPVLTYELILMSHRQP